MGTLALNLKDAYRGKRVLVTGDTGFKGSWLCLTLAQLGAEVYGYSLPPLKPSLFRSARLSALLRHRDGDIRDARAFDAFARSARPHVIFHLAAQPLVRAAYKRPKETFDINVGGSVNVLETASRLPKLKALVYITSDKCYRDQGLSRGFREDDPLGGRDPYSASKACAEVIFGSYREGLLPPSLGAASARAGNVIGGGDWAEDRIIPDAVRAILSGGALTLRNPSAVRPWQHVMDPIIGYMLLGARLLKDPERYSGSWNFGPSAASARTVARMVRALSAAWGTRLRLDLRPSPEHETRFLRLDPSKARRVLGWRQAWGFERAARETATWYRDAAAGADARALCLAQISARLGLS